ETKVLQEEGVSIRLRRARQAREQHGWFGGARLDEIVCARMGVQTGLQGMVGHRFSPLRGLRVGAIVNPTSVDAEFRHLADLLKGAEGVELRALFGPEHGVRGEAQYMVSVEDE